MTAQRDPVEFVARGLGRQVAMLGAVEVGEVCEIDGANGPRAWWRLFLPGPQSSASPRQSLDQAKAQLSERVRDWMECAGVTIARGGA